MMKKFIALLLSVSLMVCFSAVPANAAQTPSSGRMEVSYEVGDAYCINLPDLACTSSNTVFEITAEYVHITSTKNLTISVDTDQTLTDGAFYLTNGTSGNNEKMLCDICVTNSSGASTPAPYNISETNNVLAVFGAEDTHAKQYGKLALSPYVTADTTLGYYRGYIYYTIRIA